MFCSVVGRLSECHKFCKMKVKVKVKDEGEGKGEGNVNGNGNSNGNSNDKVLFSKKVENLTFY